MKHISEVLGDMEHQHRWIEATEFHEVKYYSRYVCAGCGRERVAWVGDKPALPLGWERTPVIEP